MTEATRRNVEAAFAGEAKAYFRLLAFAGKAEEEGYPQIARLFRSVAAAEAVHARSHFELLEKVGSTEENLQLSFEKETFVNEVAYPAFLKQAWADEDKLSIWYFTKARNAEERHAHLYKLAISDMASDKETRVLRLLLLRVGRDPGTARKVPKLRPGTRALQRDSIGTKV